MGTGAAKGVECHELVLVLGPVIDRRANSSGQQSAGLLTVHSAEGCGEVVVIASAESTESLIQVVLTKTFDSPL